MIYYSYLTIHVTFPLRFALIILKTKANFNGIMMRNATS